MDTGAAKLIDEVMRLLEELVVFRVLVFLGVCGKDETIEMGMVRMDGDGGR